MTKLIVAAVLAAALAFTAAAEAKIPITVRAGCRHAKQSAQQNVETEKPWGDGSVLVDWSDPYCYRRDRRRVVMDYVGWFDDGDTCVIRAVVWLSDRGWWHVRQRSLVCF